MADHDLNFFAQVGNPCQHVVACQRMKVDDVALRFIEGAWFVQHRIGDADLADIMDECPATDVLDALLIQTDLLCKAGGVFNHAA